jgi:uncharacterized protein
MGSSIGEALFGVARRSVLALLYGNPGERFYQRRVIQSLRLGSGAIQRELLNLTAAGILRRTVDGRQTYYQANLDCPIAGELQSLVRKAFGAPSILKDALAPLSNRIHSAFVFGSIAAGTESPGSDIDLMVVGDVSLLEVVTALRAAQRELAREVNPVVYPIAEFRRKLVQGQSFLARVMKGPKLFLIGDEQHLGAMAQERMAAGAPDQPRGSRRSRRGGRS